MYNYIDDKFIGEIGYKLRNFKRKSPTLYNCSCPICGDSKKNLLKARMYLIRRKSNYSVFCHNCSYSSTLPGFIKRVSPEIYRKYIFEKYTSGFDKKHHHIDPVEVRKKVSDWTKTLEMELHFDRLDEMDEDHPAVKYVTKRRIPEDKWKYLYHTPNVEEVIQLFPEYKENLAYHDSRLLIPYYDREGHLVAMQARALDPKIDEYGRYLSFKKDEDVELIYGLERHNNDAITFVTEGPIDSLFLPNALASSNADLMRVGPHAKYPVYIYDNQPRNPQLVRSMEKAVNADAKVFVWPIGYDEKDLNELIISRNMSNLVPLIVKNTYHGLKAKMEFERWKKV